MPTIKMTERAIDKLPAPHPDGKQTLYWAQDLKGFGVLCSGVSKAKSYVVQHTIKGRSRRVTIAPCNVLTLDKAREEAKLVLADLWKGVDPKAGRRGIAGETLRDVLDGYLTSSNGLREKSKTGYRSTIERHLTAWLDLPLRDITSDMVKERHAEIQRSIGERAAAEAKRREVIGPAKALLKRVEEALKATEDKSLETAAAKLSDALSGDDMAAIRSRTASLAHAAAKSHVVPANEIERINKPSPDPADIVKITGKATANAAMRALRVLWNWQADRVQAHGSLFPANPVRQLKRQWYAVHGRTRMVKAAELAKFHAAIMDLPNPIHRDYLRLLLFTGLRREEAASLTWDSIDFVERVIRLPAAVTKAGRALDLPMTDYVRDLLVGRRAEGKEKYIFPSDSKAGYVAEPKFPLNQVRLICGVDVSAHDLRRTYVTIAEGTDISPLALKALINHSLGKDVTSGYVQMAAERLREPAQRVCDRLKALCGVTAPAGTAAAGLRT